MNARRNSQRYRTRKKFRAKQTPPVALIAVAVLLVGLLIYQIARPQPGMTMPDQGNLHIAFPQTATYNSVPPTSGPHYETIAR